MQRPHVVSFNGELDIWKEREVEDRLSGLDDGAPIVIDLAGVRYLDSAFLSALVRLRRRVPRSTITLLVASPSVRRIFELTEMHRLFTIEASPPKVGE